MVIREEQERVRTLLSDTITLLCRNGLTFKNEFNISAVIGITLDKEDVLLVDIRETIKNAGGDASDSDGSEKTMKKSRKRRKRSHSSDDHVNSDSEPESTAPISKEKTDAVQERLEVKTEIINESDDEDLVFIKNEPSMFNPGVSGAYSLQGTHDNSVLQPPTSQPYHQDPGGQWNNPVPPTFEPSIPSTSIQQQPGLNLDASIAQDTSGEGGYQCPHCQRAFSRRFTLQRHVRQQHLHLDRVNCPICQKQYTRKTYMLQHLQSAHADQFQALVSSGAVDCNGINTADLVQCPRNVTDVQ